MTARRPDARTGEAARAIGGLFRLGTVVSVDLADATAVVELAPGLTTPPIPWLGRAGFFKSWLPPYAGEQVALITPDADMEQAVILGSLDSDANPAASSLHQAVLAAADGLRVEYDVASRTLTFDVPKALVIRVPQIRIEGDIQLTGRMTASDDVVADGVSLKTHRHGGVAAGAASTGAPL